MSQQEKERNVQAVPPKHVISDDTIEYVGILAKLDLSEQEREQAKEDMGRMLDYIDKLNALNTKDVEPMTHIFPLENVFREDRIINGDGRQAALKNAPVQKNGSFQVPKTVADDRAARVKVSGQ